MSSGGNPSIDAGWDVVRATDLPDEISGDVLARVGLASATAAASAAKSAAVGLKPKQQGGTASLKDQIAQESKHEIVALTGRNLTVNWGNYKRYQEMVSPTDPVMVVSLVGDTSVGKSTTISSLMSQDESKPYVPKSSTQDNSTTYNVNLYPSASLGDGIAVNFLDFEGECGSSTPAMSGAGAVAGGGGNAAYAGFRQHTARLLGMNLTAGMESPLQRSEAVREFFPKLAYCISDVVMLVGTEPFFSTRYLERAISFAKRANSGVADVDLPVLVLMSNKTEPDRCMLDIQAATERFTASMGADMATLESYFSVVICIDVPNSRSMVTDDETGAVYSGKQLFEMQMGKMKTMLSSLLMQRVQAREASRGANTVGSAGAQRLITSRHGLWFSMLPQVVALINKGDPVHVSHMVDSAWLASIAQVAGTKDQVMDVFKAFMTHARPPRSLSAGVPAMHVDVERRFAGYHRLIVDLAVRIVASRLRDSDQNLALPVNVVNFARANVDSVLAMLEELTPCRAQYGQGEGGASRGKLGTPVSHPEQPVVCLGEMRTHSKSHRGCRQVRGGGSGLWQTLVNLAPYNPTWEGRHAPMLLDVPPRHQLVQSITQHMHLRRGEWVAQLAGLQAEHSNSRVRVEFAPLAHTPRAASSSGGGAVGASEIIGVEGVRLRTSPPIEAARMPYCVGCGRKHGAKAATSGAPSGPGGSSTGPPQSPSPALGVDDAGPGDRDLTFSTWLAGVVSVMGGGSGGATGTDGAAAAAAGSAGSSPSAQGPASPLAEDVAPAAVQEVVLGLCEGCFAAAAGADRPQR